MPYQNYRTKKEKGLATLTKKTIVNVVSVPGEEEATEEEVLFDLNVKMFDEDYGTEREAPRNYRVDAESLGKEKIRLQGFVSDIDEILADMEALKKK